MSGDGGDLNIYASSENAVFFYQFCADLCGTYFNYRLLLKILNGFGNYLEINALGFLSYPLGSRFLYALYLFN